MLNTWNTSLCLDYIPLSHRLKNKTTNASKTTISNRINVKPGLNCRPTDKIIAFLEIFNEAKFVEFLFSWQSLLYKMFRENPVN